MQYRKFGKLNWIGSILGFGAMRLPSLDGNAENIDEAELIEMIRHAIDCGVNYLDTAYPYHGGKSEPLVGKALQNGYREKVNLATKLPSWLIESASDYDRYFNEQFERLQTGRIDCYLLHGLDAERWVKLQDLKVLSWAEKTMVDGRIGCLGFSFHDKYEIFKQIIDAYDNWTFCMIQYNYMDTHYQAGTRGLKYASDRGMAVIAMEPLRGGRLSKEPPQEVARLWSSAQQKRIPTEWALMWLWNQPEVSMILSGMSTMQQLRENLTLADKVKPGMLTEDDLRLINRVSKAYRKLSPVPCTGCAYCMPCPKGVKIPLILELYNDAIIYDDSKTPRMRYCGAMGLKEEQRANHCIECGDCVKACPQHMAIPEFLKKAHAMLGSDESTLLE